MNYKKISDKALDSALRTLDNNFGKDFAEKGLHESEYKAIPTGYDELDQRLTRGGSGGLFLGGVCEFFGAEASGKSSLALRTVGMAQSLGLNCAWFDAEHSFSPDLAKLNRVDLNKLVYLRRTTGEGEKAHLLNAGEVLDRIFKSVWTNAFSLIVVDSVAALMPERMVSEEYDPAKKGISELAREMSQHLPKISSACAEKECTVIFINQVRMKPMEMYGDGIETPGGKALKFYSNQRISLNKINGKGGMVTHTSEDGIEDIVGHYAKVVIKKNRRNEPCFDTLEIPIYYKEYFPDKAKTCYDLARKLQVITTRKGMLTWKDPDAKIVTQIEGESSMLHFIRGKEDVSKEAFLAYCCLKASQTDKLTKKKGQSPLISSSVKKLADEYDPSKPIEIKVTPKAEDLELED